MQIAPDIAIAITLGVVGLSLACVMLGLLVAALGYLGEIARFLAVSWLVGASLLAATTFSEIHQGASLVSPNVEVSGLRGFSRRSARL